MGRRCTVNGSGAFNLDLYNWRVRGGLVAWDTTACRLVDEWAHKWSNIPIITDRRFAAGSDYRPDTFHQQNIAPN